MYSRIIIGGICFLLLSIVSCKKAVPERASDRRKAEEIAARENALEFFTLWEVNQYWNVKTGDEIGYEMTIALNRDQSFIKQMKTKSATITLNGDFNDTTINNLPYIVLHFNNLPDSGIPDYSIPVYGNIYSNRELLERRGVDSSGLVSSLLLFDGVYFSYRKEK